MSDGESDGRLAPAVGPRGLLKSWLGFSWAMSLFGLRTLETALDPQRAAASLGAVTRAMLAALPGGALRGEAPGGAAGAGVAGGGPAAGAGSAGPPAVAPPPPPVRRGRLDTTTFVTLGEGLAAGVADFSLSARLQQDAFPAQMARQMQTGFRQALLQAPGIGNLPGFPPLPVSVPALMQTTVLEPQDAVGGALGNLSVPGFRLADALHLRPAPPLIQRDDARQTGANLILGLPELLRRPGGKLPTQLETALGRRPTLALVELGYLEAIEATVTGDLRHLPSVEGLRRDLGRLLGELRRGGAAVLVMNLPDPLDSACAPGLAAAAQVVKLPVGVLAGAYGLAPGDRITVRGLVEIGFQALSRNLGALPAGSVLAGEVAARIGERIGELNAEVARLAWEHGALVCDLHGLWRSVRDQGVQAGGRRLTAGFLGGFYSLNGYYPGKTGHAVIANLALQLLNQSFGAEFPLVDLGGVVATDPVAMYRPAAGPELAAERLRPSPPRTPVG